MKSSPTEILFASQLSKAQDERERERERERRHREDRTHKNGKVSRSRLKKKKQSSPLNRCQNCSSNLVYRYKPEQGFQIGLWFLMLFLKMKKYSLFYNYSFILRKLGSSEKWLKQETLAQA
jgi:hypothetical protein